VKIRIGNLRCRQEFVTCLTRQPGIVWTRPKLYPDSIEVVLAGERVGKSVWLHRDVLVEVPNPNPERITMDIRCEVTQ